MSNVDITEIVVRYASGGNISGNVVNGGAFVLKEKDEGRLSVHRPIVFAANTCDAMPTIRSVSRLQLRRTGRFAELSLEASFQVLSENDDIEEISAMSDALEAEGEYCADPSHAVLVGLPNHDSPLSEMCGDLIAGTVTDLHLAVIEA